MFLGKRHKSPHSTGLAITKQSENIWKSNFAGKKGGSYSEQLRRQLFFTGVILAQKPGWNLFKNAANGDKHILEE